MRTKRKLLSLLLAAALLVSAIPQTVFAKAGTVQSSDVTIGAGGLCADTTRSIQPSAAASEGTEESSCTHKHTDECYTEVTNCVHEHMPECYPLGGVSGNVAVPPDAEEQEPTECTHKCSKESGCIVQELDCTHEHDDTCGYVPADWPEPPELPDGPPELSDGQMTGEIYGRPVKMLSAQNLALLQSQSQNAAANLDESLRIPDDQINHLTFIYVNGAPYQGGDIIVTEGDNFSYMHSWSPGKLDPPWKEGSWFEYELFQVPGLNLKNEVTSSLVINGIKVGDATLTYDRQSGKMTYRVVFSRYILFFEPNTVKAMLQGSGKFTDTNADGPIDVGGTEGTLTIEPRPTLPVVPPGPSAGTGWAPAKAPSFIDKGYPFGKGAKWNSSGDPGVAPQIEWRVVFLEQLQKIQQSFLTGGSSALTTSDGNLIITEKLDANQRFYYPKYEENRGRYQNGAPFFLELPVLVPGAGNILNAVQGVGGSDYDGNGEIYPYITGNSFREIPGKDAHTAEEIKKVQQTVHDTPLSWALTIDPGTREQTLLINVGKLGGTNPDEGITWDMANEHKWPEAELDKLIANCDAKLLAIQNGADSPITLLKARQNSLLNLLERAAGKTDDQEAAKKQIESWRKDFQAWSNHPEVAPLSQLVNKDGTLVAPLPDTALAKGFQDWQVDNNRKVSDTSEYKNYLVSLENLLKDQETYLQNREQYGADWEAAREHYEQTKAFYQDGRVYGFVMKVRTESINTSASSYRNSVQINLDDSQWNADDTSTVHFSSAITGNFSLGDVVVQKADAFYDTDGDDMEDIPSIQAQNAGLAGAEFQLYYGDTGDTPPDLSADKLVHFLEKGASENGNTYLFTHIGNDEHVGIQGEITDLVTDAQGRIILGRIPPLATHWLVETKAPDGYYLDSAPIKINSADDTVTYDLRPNTSRSVLLHKVDSYSKNPVKGAQFELYQRIDGSEEKVTGFVTKELNDHQTIWKTADDSGSALLQTNAGGKLCIHGLAPGEYVLKETSPAPGYIAPAPMPEFAFTLSEKFPNLTDGKDEHQQAYDADHHILLNTEESPLENEPDVAPLTVQKQDASKKPLAGAAFTLFRFKGTEEEWQFDPDDENKWEAVPLNSADSKYFKTANKIEEVVFPAEQVQPGTKWERLPAGFTNDDGSLIITDIPVGHYSIAEVQAPATYYRDEHSLYFTVDGEAVENQKIQLYLEPQQKQLLTGNAVTNYQRQAQLALVKYDAAGDKPSIDGKRIEGGDGWLYTDKVLADDNKVKGLKGAVYKLFMRRGASSGVDTNTNPEELKKPYEFADYDPKYDTCLARGETGEDGVLLLSDMQTRNGTKIKGLNPENYYMIEVKAPEGYLLDQTPIHFKIDEKVFPGTDINKEAGLVMIDANQKTDYGLRLHKVDASTVKPDLIPVGLPGAEFKVAQSGQELYFTGKDGTYRQVPKGTQGAADTIATGDNGTLTVTGLEPDKEYVFTETKAPHGYLETNNDGKPLTISLTTAKSMQDGELKDGVLYPESIPQLENERRKGVMTLHKQDAETGEALADVEFTLFRTETEVIPEGDPDYDPTRPGATRTEEVIVQTGRTDGNGDLTFYDLDWSQYYYVLETEAPEGYLLDQTKRSFTIDENSFDADGNPIPILFPLVTNSKGALGEAVLYKADAQNHDLRLEDAHFYLMKKVGQDANGKDIWTGYGQGIYITDDKGELRFLLPPGLYSLTEMKAPDGYISEGMQELFFEIPEDPGDDPVVIDEENSKDGIVINRKGESGVRIRKTFGESDSPVPGATFRIGWEAINGRTLEYTYYPLHFVHRGGGNYEYTKDDTVPGATTDLVTDADGMIYVMMPADEKDYPPPGSGGLESFGCWETDAPDGLRVDGTFHSIARPLPQGFYEEVEVSNLLKPEGEEKLSITLYKQDGKSKRGLPGAVFDLYLYMGPGEDMNNSHLLIGTGITDENGTLVFDKSNTNLDPIFVGLMVGGTYHIVEREVPTGYVKDETHHEVTLDARYFDENFHFKGVSLTISNYQISGSVHLKKTAADDPGKGLPGAEFELLRKSENADPLEAQWEHYGEWRYITDEDGGLHIENLPYGSYQLMERAAPLGYLLDDPAWTASFQIDTNGQRIDLGDVTNRVDPNPTRDVYVQKVAAHDTSLGLPGAEFELYELQADGNYYLLQSSVYVTDDSGGFVIGSLPVGSYALREIKAPDGYDLPEQTMTYFSVQVQEREVRLQIQNAKTEEESAASSLTVQKLWEDDSSARRPDSILVQLYRNDAAYGRPVALNAGNNWQYRWDDLEKGVRWTVDEVQVPNGYQRTVTHEGNAWTITNTAEGNVPTDPDEPENPGESGDSGEQGASGESGESGASGQPADAAQSNDPNRPADNAPQTGDSTGLSLWITLAVLSGIGLLMVWIGSVYRKRKK